MLRSVHMPLPNSHILQTLFSELTLQSICSAVLQVLQTVGKAS
jgi:hypothetical protein